MTPDDIRRESMRVIRQDYKLSQMHKVLKAGYAMRVHGPSAVGRAVEEISGRKVKPLPQFVKA